MQEAAQEGQRRWTREIGRALEVHRDGARNLAAYLGLRSRALAPLQLELARVGLSSVGRSVGHVMDTLARLRAWVEGRPGEALEGPPDAGPDRAEAEARLHAHTRALFGPRPADRHVHIMVTAPADPGPAWADAVLRAGATLLRINGAQGSPASWSAAAQTFRDRAARLGLEARVLVDLPGPKLRVFIPPAEPGVLHLHRRRDRSGKTTEPARIPLRFGPERDLAELPLPAEWQVEPGDEILLEPQGQRSTVLRVVPLPDGFQGESEDSFFVAAGQPVAWRRAGLVLGRGRVGQLPLQPGECRFQEGDLFRLRAPPGGARPPAATSQDLGTDPTSAAVPAGTPTLDLLEPGILESVRAGDRVLLDDGRVLAAVEDAGCCLCRVRAVAKPGVRIRSGKGVTFPDTRWRETAEWPGDEAVLGFALKHADAVGLSFVCAGSDVDRWVEVLSENAAAGGRRLGLVVKLETRAAMAHLEEILFAALRHAPVGLMIARGDLALELSYERLAEVQEEILCLGEACHIPVIWATQVLENMARSGVPTRAEVTDAAMGMRAECIMLNRGPRMVGAVRLLARIIRRMEVLQFKRRQIFHRGLAGRMSGSEPNMSPKRSGSGDGPSGIQFSDECSPVFVD